MAELFFILTTVFVAYVVFVVMDDENRKKQENKPTVKPAVAEVKSEAAAKPQPAVNKPIPAKKSPTKVVADSLKNPETGEVVKVPNNYRFAKRWIKEALVAEGLLEKIYKNNELDEEVAGKIKVALEQLKALEKYQ